MMRLNGRSRGVRGLRGPEQLEARRLLAVFNVNTTQDTVDADLTDGLALDINGNTSLRAAVMQANASPGDDVINLPEGNYALTITSPPPGADAGSDSYDDLDIFDDTGLLTIVGTGASETIIDADVISWRAFEVEDQGRLFLSNLSVTGGNVVEGFGGAIRSSGALALSMVHLYSNRADLGGGIYHAGFELTIDQSTLSNNTALFGGGGLAVGIGPTEDATVAITNSTVSGNSVSDGEGGGLLVLSDPEFGIAPTVNLQHVTIASNSAQSGVGVSAPSLGPSRVNVLASIIADNFLFESELDVRGLFTTQGSNVIGRADPLSGFVDGVANDLVGSSSAPIPAGLAPLENFAGSPTPVHRLFSTSPAVDHVDLEPPPLLVDQRGRSREEDAAPDSGAFEFVGGSLNIDAFHDLNRNAIFDPGEVLSSFDVRVELNRIGENGDSPPTITIEGPTPLLVSRLDPGSYVIVAEFLDSQRVLGTRVDSLGFVSGEFTESAEPLGAYRYGEIHGEKFLDLLGDGLNDSDPPLENIRFDLVELGPDLILGTEDDQFFEPVFTDADGRFSFTRLLDGNYAVLETPPEGSIVTTGEIPILSVGAGSLFIPAPGFVTPDNNQSEIIVPELSVGNAFNSEIRGRVVFDVALDGFDVDDPGIATFELILQAAGPDGEFGSEDDGAPLATFSLEDGTYAFPELTVTGLYRLTLGLREHYFSTSESTVEFELSPGDLLISDPALGEVDPGSQTPIVNPDLGFGVMRFAALVGLTFDDLNADGTRQAGAGSPELPRAGQPVDLYQQSGSAEFDLVASAISSSAAPPDTGTYVWDDLSTGTYLIDQILAPERGLTSSERSFPVSVGTIYAAPGLEAGQISNFPLDDFEEGIVSIETLDRLELGSRELVEIRGNILDDLNGDGIANPGEDGLADWTVVLARTERRYVQDELPSVHTAVTDANGDYAFRVWPGEYHIAEVLEPGYEPTGPRIRFEEYDGFLSGTGPSVSKVSGLAVADLNGDGIDEIIVANDFSDIVARTSSMDVFYSQADGSRNRVELPLGQAMRPQHVVATDLENDQDLDLVVVAIGTGAIDPTSGTNLAFGDLIVFRNEGGVLSRLDAEGNVATEPPRDGDEPRPVDQTLHGNGPSHVSVGYLNDDMLVDLVVTNLFSYDPVTNPTVPNAEDVSVLLQTAPGVFTKHQTIDLSGMDTDAQVISTTVGDFNDDGFEDIAVGASGLQSIELFWGGASVEFGSSNRQTLSGLSKPSHLLTHDLDGDGLQDLIVTDYSADEVLIYHQSTNGLGSQPLRLPTAGKPQWLAVGDLNSDATPDIVVTHASTNVVQPLFNLGGRQYVPAGDSEIGSNLRFTAIAPNGFDVAFGKVAVGQLNGDDFDDVVVAQFTSGVTGHINLAETFGDWLDSRPDGDGFPLLGDDSFQNFPGVGGPGPALDPPDAQATTIGQPASLELPPFTDSTFEQQVELAVFANYSVGVALPPAHNLLLSAPAVTRPFHNFASPLDVNGDTQITPLDALWIINTLNTDNRLDSGTSLPEAKADVSNDGQITPLDALLVVNYLNAPIHTRSVAPTGQQATVAVVERLAATVTERLVASGLEQSLADQLNNLTWQVVDLPVNVLARTAGSVVYIDWNAAGWGWLVERRPGPDTQWQEQPWQDETTQDGRDAAFLGQVDLLSTIAHELGHVLGLAEDSDAESIMFPSLKLRQRTVSQASIDRLLAKLE